MSTLHEWIAERVAEAETVAAGSPAAIRRCEADRRILDRHRAVPGGWPEAPACEGCGTYGDPELASVDNVNDCPELLDLAHAHGLTGDILVSLDRPEEPAPAQPHPQAITDARHRLHTATPARNAPATFRR